MERIKVVCPDVNVSGTVVHVAADDCYAGYILISDEIKDDSLKAVSDLKAAGIGNIAILTGDEKRAGEEVAKKLGVKTIFTELLPGDKMDRLEELLLQKSANGKLVYVGDGINDAPALARSDIGVAMGGLGSDAAIEAADVVIMTDEPSKVATAIRISKKTTKIVKQNIVFSLAVKAGVLVLASVGFASMRMGVAADVGVMLIAVLNATRALKIKKY